MRTWHRCTAEVAATAFLVLTATPSQAQSPAASPAVNAPAMRAPAAQAPTTQPTTVAEPPPPLPEPPAARPLQDSVPSGATVRQPRDLSPWSMFLAADIVVKVVMVSLAFASLVTWTIFFAKTMQLARAQRRLRIALTLINDAGTLSEAQTALKGRGTALAILVRAAMHEVRLSGDRADDAGIKERSASRFAEIARTEARVMRHGMAMLATIGATSPFVGLFGTVWGIMNSFIGISKAQTTNLAVVAPGIAEALLATAIGLVAAIPAVIIYNHFSRATKAYLEYVGRGSGAVGRLLSRDLDRSRHRPLARAAE
jgi:biopolymer transport protein ExbB